MKQTVTVRWATENDQTFLETAGVIRLPEGTLRRKLEAQEVIVAFLEQRPVGHAHIDYLWSYVPFIATIWVGEGERGRGVGRAIVEFLARDARSERTQVIYSLSQCDEVEPQAWHRRVGFEECGLLAGHNEGVGELFFRKRVG